MSVGYVHPFIFDYGGGGTKDACSEYKIYLVDFEDWMPFESFILYKRSALIRKPSLEIPKAIHQHGIAEK